MDEKVISKLAHIKALAERGRGGEAKNAERLLQKLLSKYNIKEEDVLDNKKEKFEFRYRGVFGQELFHQIIYAVNPDIEIFSFRHRKKSYQVQIIECTKAEFMEISEMFDFYRNHLDKGLWNYYRAFIQTEKIFPEKEREGVGKTYSDEEIEELLKLTAVMDKHERHLKIEGGAE